MRTSTFPRLVLLALVATLLPLAVATPAAALTCDLMFDHIFDGDTDGENASPELGNAVNWENPQGMAELPGPSDSACIPANLPLTSVRLSSGALEVAEFRSSLPVEILGGLLHINNVSSNDSLLDEGVLVQGPGHLRVDGTLSGNDVDVTTTLQSGGRLSGNGTLLTHVANNGGVVAPGTSSLGTLTINGDFLQNSGRIDIRINLPANGSSNDGLVVQGPGRTIALNGSVRVTRTGDLPAIEENFRFFDSDDQPASNTLAVIDGTVGDGRSFDIQETANGTFALDLVTIEEPPQPAPTPVTVSLQDVTARQGADGTTQVDLTAVLNRATTTDVDLLVDVTSGDQTSTAQAEFQQTTCQQGDALKIPAGDIAACLALELTTDPGEDVEVTIRAGSVTPTSVQVGQGTATITVLDPALPLDDPSLNPVGFGDTCINDTDGPGLVKTEPSAADIALGTLNCAAPQSVDTVLIGRDDDFADSLASGVMQGRAPLLLIPGSGPVPESILGTLDNLGARNIIILGGELAVVPDVEQQLDDAGYTVARREGITRIETAIDVAATDAPDATTAIIARAFPGEDATQAFADAIAAGGMAADLGYPILFTEQDRLTTATAAYLEDSDITEVFVMGGTAAVSEETVAQIEAVIPGTVTRVAGDSRAGTAVEIAKERDFDSAADVAQLILVEGQTELAWAGGLSAAFQSARDDAPIILLDGDDVPPETEDYLTPNAEFAIPLIDPAPRSITCSATTPGCVEARRLLGLDGTTVTFDPPSLSTVAPGTTVTATFDPVLTEDTVVTYSGTCLDGSTTDPAAVVLRDDDLLPAECTVIIVINYPSGVRQTARAGYLTS